MYGVTLKQAEELAAKHGLGIATCPSGDGLTRCKVYRLDTTPPELRDYDALTSISSVWCLNLSVAVKVIEAHYILARAGSETA